MKRPSSTPALLLSFSGGTWVPVGTWTAQEADSGWGGRNAALAPSPEAFDLPEADLGGGCI